MDSQASVDLVKTKLSNLYKLRNSAILNVPSSSTSQTKKKTDKVDTVYMSSLAKVCSVKTVTIINQITNIALFRTKMLPNQRNRQDASLQHFV